MPKKTRISNLSMSVIAVGAILSIILAILPFFLGTTGSINLLVGLMAVITTLLLSVIVELKQSELMIIQNIKLGEAIGDDLWLLDALRDIVQNYHTVTRRDIGFFRERAKAEIKKCHGEIHNLSQGVLTSEASSELSFRISGILKAESSVDLVQFADPSYWRGPEGRQYLKLHRDAIAKRVKITRIWVQDKATLMSYKDIILEQAQILHEVYVVERDVLPDKLRRDFGVIDGQILVHPLPARVDGIEQERISIDPEDVEAARDDFERLRQLGTKAGEFFKQ